MPGGYSSNPQYRGIANQFKALSALPDFKVYFQKNACDLHDYEMAITGNDTYESITQNYINDSNWGRLFLIDLGNRYGEQTVVDALRAVYEKYRYTHLTKISNQDFYDAFTYFMKGLPLQSDASSFLRQKLCL